MTFNVEELLAVPLSQSIRLRYGPDPDQVVFIDQSLFEANKEKLISFCIGIPNAEGASWQLLRPYTDGNGLMAKVLIALGDLAGAWKMHPSPDYPALWHGHSMYPCVLGGSLASDPHKRFFPKPSSGDLDMDKSCVCCQRQMGPCTSNFHDLIEDTDDICIECSAEGCVGEGYPCKLKLEKPDKSKLEKRADKNQEASPSDEEVGFEEYARRLG